MELVHIVHRRNIIEIRRRRAKSKIAYYEELKQLVKSYKADAAALRDMYRDCMKPESSGAVLKHRQELYAAKKAKVESYSSSSRKMKPFKWLDNLSGLNKRILKHRAEYMKARYETARLTCQTRKRVARLTSLLGVNINYQMGTGFVGNIIVFRNTPQQKTIDATEFEPTYREVEANRAIERMLKSDGNEEKKTN